MRTVTLTPEPPPVAMTPATARESDIPLSLDAYERHALVRAPSGMRRSQRGDGESDA